jgi:hypothetical protein
MKSIYLAAAAATALIGTAASAQTYSTGFEAGQGFASGSTPSAGSAEGNTGWEQAPNGSTNGQFVSGVAKTGTQSLAISRNNSGNDGVIHGVRSPELSQSAGESANSGGFNQFTTSYWFRSGPDSSTAANGQAFRVEINAWADAPSDRMSWLRFQYGGAGSGYDLLSQSPDAAGVFSASTRVSGLAFGEWYQVEQTIAFLDGADNDVITTILRDSGGNVLTNFTDRTWEGFYRTAGIPLSGVDQLNFRSSYGFNIPGNASVGVQGYIDDLTFSAARATAAVPEPATWAMMIMGFGLVGANLRRRTKNVHFA